MNGALVKITSCPDGAKRGAEHMSAIVALPALTFVSVFLAIPPQKPSLHVVHIVFITVESSHNYHGEAEIRRDKHPFRTNVCLKFDSFQNYGGKYSCGDLYIARYNARLMHAYCTLQCTLHCTLRNPYAGSIFGINA